MGFGGSITEERQRSEDYTEISYVTNLGLHLALRGIPIGPYGTHMPSIRGTTAKTTKPASEM